jgi:hypothetical protein
LRRVACKQRIFRLSSNEKAIPLIVSNVRPPGTARSFFSSQLYDPKSRKTKKQIFTRLWGVMSNASLERMFSHKDNRIDLFDLLSQCKIIFINTAKDLLGQEGSAIFGRFFIALISQAAVQRAAIAPHERRPAFVYIDKAQDYFDSGISNLLNQARKYRIDLIFSRQNLDQLTPDFRANMLSSTSVKSAGGLSAKDASTLDSDFRCDSSFLISQRKGVDHTRFACYVKNYTKHALSVSIPLGFLESEPQSSDEEYEFFIDINRIQYCDDASLYEEGEAILFSALVEAPAKAKQTRREVPPSPAPPEAISATPEHQTDATAIVEKRTAPAAKSKVAKESGRGGRQHKYLQALIKGLAEERGFLASTEATILDGAGRVDVSLRRDDMRVACQVSITTGKDWELGGIERCFAAGYSVVALICGSDRHLTTLSKFIEGNLNEAYREKVRYVAPEAIPAFLDGLGQPIYTEQVIRGYTVRTTKQGSDTSDAAAKRKAITEVIARSINRS